MNSNKQSILKDIISTKGTNICLAADVETIEELFSIIDKLGPYICMLKLHYDIIANFHDNLEETISKLNSVKQKYNFLIWEDRKFADIGYIMERQVKNHIIRWADVISVHPIAGKESLEALSNLPISLIIIGELSSSNSLTNSEYQTNVMKTISNSNNENIIGIVCQHKMSDTLLNVLPGITFNQNKTDTKGQQYRGIGDDSTYFADIYVIGRSLINSNNPVELINKFQTDLKYLKKNA